VSGDEFEILSEIADVEVIAIGRRIRELTRLTKRYIGRRDFKRKRYLDDN